MNNYSITFKSLRAGTVYTLNIGGGTGAAIPLKGGAQPFTTQEDDSDDMFTPIRTQTGYIRIEDDGKDANGAAWKWKDLLPATDTSRPVTLTGVDAQGNSLGTLWQGFMQAQNFGGVLYGNPQEREFPVQCILSVTEGTDINYQQTEIKNFAYLLQQIINSVPSAQRPTSINVQGGSSAQDWLLKCIDWQNFSTVDDDDNQSARLNMYQCLEDMCRFWGWTARTCGSVFYLTCADDPNLSDWLVMTPTELNTMAGGVTAGTISSAPSAIEPSGDIFASVNQDDFICRGYNKSMVTVDTNPADEYIIDPFDYKLEKEMKDHTWNEGYFTSFDGKYLHYSPDVLIVDRFYLDADAVEDYASFNVVSTGITPSSATNDIGNCISIKKTYTGSAFVTLYSIYEHCFHDGFFRISGDVYRNGERYNTTEDRWYAGNAEMWMRLGIGKTRATAKWWDGHQWVDNVTAFRATIGNRDAEIFTRYYTSYPTQATETNIIAANNLSGRVFVELLGTDDSRVSNIGNEKRFDIKDFKISFTKNNTVAKTQYPNSGWWDITNLDRPKRYVYKATNHNPVRNEYDVDAVYGSEDRMVPGYSILINPANNTYLTTLGYNGTQKHPEQHLADRVTTYWATSKRKLATELLTNIVGTITPQDSVELDSTTGHPISISHDWRDDITQLTILAL